MARGNEDNLISCTKHVDYNFDMLCDACQFVLPSNNPNKLTDSNNNAASNVAMSGNTSSAPKAEVEVVATSNSKNVSVSGVLPENTSVSVNTITKENAIEKAKNHNINLNENTILNAYDISLNAGNTKYQPANDGRSVRVKLSNLNLDTNKTYALIHFIDDENYETIPAKVLNSNELEFTTTRFSTFVLVNGYTVTFEGDNYRVYNSNGTELYGEAVVAEGTNVEFSVVPAAGYKIDDITSTTTITTSGYEKGKAILVSEVASDVTITVTTSSYITKEPQSTKVVAGEVATFSVEAPSATSFKWQYKLADSDEWTDVNEAIGTGFDTANLSIYTNENVVDEDLNFVSSLNNARIRCVVTINNTSLTSSEAALVLTSNESNRNIEYTNDIILNIGGHTVRVKGENFIVTDTNGTVLGTGSEVSSANNVELTVIANMGYMISDVTSDAAITTSGYEKGKSIFISEVTSDMEITVTVTPYITEQPQSVKVVAGSTATFSVTAPTATEFKWQYSLDGSTTWTDVDSTLGTGADSSSLTIVTNENLKDTLATARFRCVVTCGSYVIPSDEASLVLASDEATRNVQFTENIIVIVGEHAVMFEGGNYSLYDSLGNALTTGTVIEDTENLEFTVIPLDGYEITGVTASDAGVTTSGYEKIKAIYIPSVTEAITVSVETVELVEITKHPESAKIVAGEDATFTVEAPNATSYKWQYMLQGNTTWNNFDANSSTGYDTATLTVPTTRNIYDIDMTKVDELNGARIRCIVTVDGDSKATNEAGLVITSYEANRDIKLYTDTDIIINIGGYSVTFAGENFMLYDTLGNEITNLSNHSMFTETRFYLAPSYGYTISNVTADDDVYTVSGFEKGKVIDLSEDMLEKDVVITVTTETMLPVITSQPTSVKVAEGSETATYSVVANNATSFTWEYKLSGDEGWTAVDDTIGTGYDSEVLTVNITGEIADSELNIINTLNSASFRCVVKNDTYEVASDEAKLIFAMDEYNKNITLIDGIILKIGEHTITFLGEDFRVYDTLGNEYENLDEVSSNAELRFVVAPAEGSAIAEITSEDVTVLSAGDEKGKTIYISDWDMASDIFVNVTNVTSPFITAHPENVKIKAGETATFTVEATGASTYKWEYRLAGEHYWNDVDDTIGTGFDTATLSVLTNAIVDDELNFIESLNGAEFRCRVTDVYTLTTEKATLTIAVDDIMEDVKFHDGEDLIIKVGKYSVTFTGNNFRVYDTLGNEVLNFDEFELDETLRFTIAPKTGYILSSVTSDSASFAAAGDEKGKAISLSEITSDVTVTIVTTEGVEITEQPQSAKVKPGEDAIFTIVAPGATTYTWQYMLSGDTTWTDVDDTIGTDYNTATLVVKTSADAVDEDMNITDRLKDARFRCIVANENYSYHSNEAALVIAADDIETTIKYSSDFIIYVGDNVITLVGGNFKVYDTLGNRILNHDQLDATAELKFSIIPNNGYDVLGITSEDITVTSSGSENGKLMSIDEDLTGNVVINISCVESVITKHPESTKVVAGETATFTVETSGDVASYKWQYLPSGEHYWEDVTEEIGEGFDTATLSVLTEKIVDEELNFIDSLNGAKFRCVVTTTYDMTSEEATLIVTSNETDMDIVATEDFIIFVGDYAITFRGSNFKLYDTLGNQIFKFASLEAATELKFSIIPNNGYVVGDITSEDITVSASGSEKGKLVSIDEDLTKNVIINVNIIESVITKHPESVKVKAGETATFTVETSGEVSAYKWQYLPSGEHYWEDVTEEIGEGFDTATLNILTEKIVDEELNFIESLNGAKFRCVVTSTYDMTSEEATLVVTSNETEEDIVLTDDFIVFIGENALILKGGHFRVYDSARNEIQKFETLPETIELRFELVADNGYAMLGVTSEDAEVAAAGSEKAKVMTIDEITKDTVVNVNVEKSVITKHPESVKVPVGEIATFTVETSSEDVTYKWQYKPSGEHYWNDVDSTIGTGFDTNTLRVVAPEIVDDELNFIDSLNGAKFRCIVTTTYDMTSEEATLIITSNETDKDFELADPEDFMITIGEHTVVFKGGHFRLYDSARNEIVKFDELPATIELRFELVADNGYAITDITSEDAEVAHAGSEKAKVMTIAEITKDTIINVAVEKSVITKHPESAKVKVGETATFTVETTGEVVSYKWQYKPSGEHYWNDVDETIGTGFDTNTLSVVAPEIVDDELNFIDSLNGAKFRCIVTTTYDMTSEEATLIVTSNETEEEIIYTEDIIIFIGEHAVFFRGGNFRVYDIIGNEMINYATYPEETELKFSIMPKNGYTITNIASEDVTVTMAGSERGKVISIAEELTSDVVIDVTNVASIITKHPVDAKVEAGETATFTVETNGTATSYKWEYLLPGEHYWNDVDDTIGTGFDTETLSVLTDKIVDDELNFIESLNGAKFRCIVTGAYEATSEEATLIVTSNETDMDITVSSGDDIIITIGEHAVIFRGGNFRVYDIIGNEMIHLATYPEDTELKFSIIPKNGYTITNITSDDTTVTSAGSERGKVISIAELTKDTIINVTNVTSIITKHPEDAKVVAGEEAIFTVETSGDVTSYKWECLLPGEHYWNDVSGEIATGFDTATLSVLTDKIVDEDLNFIESLNGAKFRCIVTGTYEATSEEATLIITSNETEEDIELIEDYVIFVGEHRVTFSGDNFRIFDTAGNEIEKLAMLPADAELTFVAKADDAYAITGITCDKVTIENVTSNAEKEKQFSLGTSITEDLIVTIETVEVSYTDGTNGYFTLQEAFEKAESGKTITVLRDKEETTSATVETGKEFVLDLNGKTITVGVASNVENFILNNGTLTIDDTSEEKNGIIETANANETYIENLINNTGILNIEDGTIVHNGTTSNVIWRVIYNTGVNAIINLNNGIIKGTLTEGESSEGSIRVIQISGGQFNMTGGSILCESAGYAIESYYVQNRASINISGGYITTVMGGIFMGGGTDTTLNISGGIIENNVYEAIRIGNCGNVVITGGTLKGINETIQHVGNCELTIGNSGDSLNQTSPVIIGETYAIESVNGFNFYDGILKGIDGAYSGEARTKSESYAIVHDEEEIGGNMYKTAYLMPVLMEREGPLTSGGEEIWYAIGAKRASTVSGDEYLNYTADKISTITLEDTNVVPADAIASWDVSYKYGDNAIIAWLMDAGTAEDGTQMYDLHIGGNGGIMAPEDSNSLFRHYKNCITISELHLLDTSNANAMYAMFHANYKLKSLNISTFDTKNVTTMTSMFNQCLSLNELTLGKLDTSNLKSTSFMFSQCSSLETLDVRQFNVDNVEEMRQMFYGCGKVTELNVEHFNTSNVTTMWGMFSNCTSLKIVDVSGFDTSKVENFGCMFEMCTSLENIDVSEFDTKNAITLERMFSGSNKIKVLDVSNWNTINVENMHSVFYNCSSLNSIDLSGWNVVKVTDMDYIFSNCTNLQTILLGKNFNQLNGNELFSGDTNLTAIITEKSNPMILSGDTGLASLPNAILYVPNESAEDAYEAETSYINTFSGDKDVDGDIYRIRPILELSGDSTIILEKGEDYIEQGYTVAGFDITNSGDTFYGYEVTVTGADIDTTSSGEHEVIYELTRTYKVTSIVSGDGVQETDENGNVKVTETVVDDVMEAKRTVIVQDPELEATVTITGTNKTGETLTAELSELPEGTVITYEWYTNAENNMENGTLIEGENASTLTVTDDYENKYIYVVVTLNAPEYRETKVTDITDEETNEYAKAKAEQIYDDIIVDTTKPTATAPTVEGNSNKIIITSNQEDEGTGIVKVEYGYKAEGDAEYTWQDENIVTDLAQGTVYEIVTKATDEAGNEQISDVTTFETADVVITGKNESGETLTAELSGVPADAEVTYEWYTSKEDRTTGGTLIESVTGKTLEVTEDYADKYIYVVVTIKSDFYGDEQVTDITDDETNGSAQVPGRPIYDDIIVDTTKPTNTAPTVVEENGVVIVTPNQEDENGVEKVEYGYRVSGDDEFTWQDDGTIEGLEPGTEYEFVTKATDGAGNEQISEITSLKIKAVEFKVTFVGDNFKVFDLEGFEITGETIVPVGEVFEFRIAPNAGYGISNVTSTSDLVELAGNIKGMVGLIGGSEEDVTITVTTVAAPVITKEPQIAKIESGDTSASFTVEAANATTFEWQYRENSGDYWKAAIAIGTGADTTEFTVTAKEALNGEYEFRCLVGNEAFTADERVQSNIVKISVAQGDEGTEDIEKVSVELDLTITGTNKNGETLTAKVTNLNPSDASLTYKWFYADDNSMTGGTEIKGVTGNTLKLTNEYANKYIYVEVTASREFYETASYTAVTSDKIIGIYSITFVGDNFKVINEEDEDITAGVEIIANSLIITVTPEAGFAVTGIDATDVTIKTEGNTRGYVATITEITDDVEIAITTAAAPTITKQPEIAKIESGDTSASFTVEAENATTFEWQYRENSGDYWKAASVIGTGADTAEFTVTALEALNSEYEFRCLLGNEVFTGDERVQTNTVRISIAQGEAGSEELVDCTITFVGDNFTAYNIEGEDITEGYTVLGLSNVTFLITPEAGYAISEVISSDVSVEIDGNIKGYVGTIARIGNNITITVTTEAMPTITKEPQIAKIESGDTSATFTVEAENATTYEWQYRENSGDYWKAASVIGTGADTAEFTVTALEALNSEYEFRCLVGNEVFTADDRVKSNTVRISVAQGDEGTEDIEPLPIELDLKLTGTNKAGETLTAQVSNLIPSDANLTYRWFYDDDNDMTGGTEITGVTGNTLELTNEYANKYIYVEVTASREYYVTQTVTAVTKDKIIGIYNITFVGNSFKVINEEDEDITAGVEIIANSLIITVTPESGYAVTGVTTSDATIEIEGNIRGYTATITGITDDVTITVTTVAGPTITKQPEFAKVNEGETPIFTVEATNATSFEWQYRENSGDYWKVATSIGTGTDTNSFTVTALEALNSEYEFRCLVGNEVFTGDERVASNTVKVSIAQGDEDVEIGEITERTITFVGDNFKVFDANDEDITAGAIIPVNEEVRIFVEPAEGFAVTNAVAENITIKVEGNIYGMTIILSDPIDDATITVTTVAMPTITKQPEFAKIESGDVSATFTVEATNATTYEWQYRENSGDYWKAASVIGTGADTAEFTVTSLEALNSEYEFRCLVGNEAFTGDERVQSNIVRISIAQGDEDVEIEEIIERTITFVGDNFKVYDENDEDITNGCKVLGNENFKFFIEPAEGYAIIGVTSSDVNVGIEGNIKGFNGNIVIGESDITITVTTVAIPTITKQPEFAKIESGDTTASFTVEAENATTYEWQYRENSGDYWKVASSIGTGADTVEFTVTALEALNSEYEFRCLVGNEAFTGDERVESNTVRISIAQGDEDVEIEEIKERTITFVGDNFKIFDLNGDEILDKILIVNVETLYAYRIIPVSGYGVTEITSTYSSGESAIEVNGDILGKVVSIDNIVENITINVTTVAAPVITKEPEIAKIESGDTSASFTVEAENATSFEWQYRENSGDYWKVATSIGTGADTNSFTVTSLEALNSEYEFRCLLGNEVFTGDERVRTDVVRISIAQGDEETGDIVIGNHEITFVGDNFKVYDLAGNELANVVEVRRGLDFSFRIVPVSGYGITTVTCTIATGDSVVEVTGNVLGKVASITNVMENLTVNIETVAAPSITSEPAIAKIESGDTSASFTVEAENATTYEWQYRENSGDYWKVASAIGTGADTTEFTVTALEALNSEYEFRCLVGNEAFTGDERVRTDIVRISIAQGDEETGDIIVDPLDELSVTFSGDNFKVYDASGDALEKSFIIMEASNLEFVVVPEDGYGIASVTCTNSGDVSVLDAIGNALVMEGKLENIRESLTVNVVTSLAPSFTKHPESAKVTQSDKVTFTVEAENATTYEWQYRATSDDVWQTVPSSIAADVTSATLEISSVTYELSGYEFRCLVGNEIFVSNIRVPSNIATVIVTNDDIVIGDIPVILVQPQSAKVPSGETATLEIVAAGEGLTLTWEYRLSGDDDWKIVDGTVGSISEVPSTSGELSIVTSTLTTIAITEATSGMEFRVLVENEFYENINSIKSDVAVVIAAAGVDDEDVFADVTSVLMEREARDKVGTTDVYYAIGAKQAFENGLIEEAYKADQIRTITLVSTLTVPDDVVASWDASFSGDKGVMAWIVESGDKDGVPMYELYIGGNGEIIAPENSTNLFRNYINCTAINNLELLDTSSVTNMSQMFKSLPKVTALDVGNFDTSNVTAMNGMFYDCKSVSTLNVINFNTSKVRRMDGMFQFCYGLTSLDVSNFDTSNVTNMRVMFDECKRLTTIDVSNFNTENVKDMFAMFYDCKSVTNLELSGFDTSNVVDMSEMFYKCSALTTIDLRNFNTENVQDMSSMFEGCAGLTTLDITNFDTSNVASMNNMFSGCSSLEILLLGKNFTKLDGSLYGDEEEGTLEGLFTGDTNLTRIIAQRTTPMTLSGDTSLDTLPNAILYVPTEAAEYAYEQATNYGATFADDRDILATETVSGDMYRIRPILELSGDKLVTIGVGDDYVDEAGVTVAGFESIIAEQAKVYEEYGYKVTTTNNIDKTTEGDYEYTFILSYKDPTPPSGETAVEEEVMRVSRIVAVRNIPTMPVITVKQGSINIETGNWASGDLNITIDGSTFFSGDIKYQYSFDEETWVDGDSLSFTDETSSTTIYAKAVALDLESAVASFEIKLDKTAPTVTSATVGKYNDRNEIITVTAKDEGTAPSGILYYAVTSENKAPTDGWQTSNELEVSENGTWFIFVQDVAGNISETAYEITTSDRKIVEVTYEDGTVEYFEDTKTAFDELEEDGVTDATIKLLEDDVTTEDITNDIVGDIVLDLNGNTLTVSGDAEIINNGTLEIVNTSGDTGSIVGDNNGDEVIENNGNLTIDGNIEITSKADEDETPRDVITNNEDAVLNLVSGDIINETSGDAISSSGEVNITGGTVISSGDGLNIVSGDANVSGNVTIETEGNGITVGPNAEVTIEDGTITSTDDAIVIEEGGKVVITGGEITSEEGIAIENEGELTLGTSDGTVNTEEPLVNGYEAGVNNSGDFNFYDGKIISTSDPIEGEMPEVEDGYFVKVNEGDEYNEAYLESLDTYIESWDISKEVGVDNVTAGIKFLSGDGTLEGSNYILVIEGTGATKDFAETLADGELAPWLEKYGDKILRVELEDGVTEYGDYLLADLPNVTDVTMPDTLETLGDYVFKDTGLEDTVNIPAGVTTIGANPFVGTNVEEITVDEANTVFEAVDGVLYDKVNNELITYPAGKVETEYSIKDGTETVGEMAFTGSNVETVTIPETVTTIEESAFQNAENLQTVYLKVTDENISIGDNAFMGIAEGSEIYTESKAIADKFIAGQNYNANTTSIYYPFEITKDIEDITVTYGETIKFEPTIQEGNPADDVKYQWYKDGVAIDGANGPVFTKTDAGASDVGSYKLVIESAIYDGTNYYYTVESKEASVTVADSSGPESVTVSTTYSGDEAIVKVTAKDENTGIEDITVNGEPIEDLVIDDENGTATGEIIIDEKGEYEIIATDKEGNTTTEIITAYEIIYDSNGGYEVTGETMRQIKIGGFDIEIRESGFNKIGHTFALWNTMADGKGTIYYPGDMYSEDADATMYAFWGPNKYTVTFYNNNGIDGTQIVSQIEVNYGEIITVPGRQDKAAIELNEDYYRIYTHFGWSGESLNPDAEKELVEILDDNKESVIMIDSDVNYYAMYTYRDVSTKDASVYINGDMIAEGTDVGIYNKEGMVVIGKGDTEDAKPTISGDTAIVNDNGLVLWYMGILQGPVEGYITNK